MKNFLSKLWSSAAGSQRNDVEFDRRLTVGSPSGLTINWTLKLVSVLVLVLTIGSGNVWGETVTYTHDFTTTISSGDNTLSTITWTASSLSSVGSYNSDYKGVQIGTKSATGAITLTSKNNWGAQTGTSFYGYTKVKKVYVWLNNGSGTISASVTVGGTACTKSGTVSKNSSATSQRNGTSQITYTPAVGHTTGAIVISVSTSSKAGYLCAIQVECEEPDVSYNVDWYVGGTRTKQETGVTSGTPPSVADNALGGSCSSLKFLGWSETNIGSAPDDAPADLFPSDNVPSLTGNKTFYAVFGDVSYDTDGTPVKKQTHQYDTWTYSGTAGDQSTYRLFGNGAYVQTDALDLSALAKVIVYGGTYGGGSYNGISIKDASGNVWKTGTVSGTSQTGTNNFTDGASLTGTKALRVYSTSGNGSSTGVRISKVEVYMYPEEYSNCVTTCCDKNITLSNPTITGTGATITFDKSSPVATCDGNQTVTATVTVTEGYQVTALSFSGGSVSVSPAISTPITSTTNYTLTFTQNTNATLTTTATAAAKPLTSISISPSSGEVYVGQYVDFTVSYNPADYLSQGYTLDATPTYVTKESAAPANTKLRLKGGRGSGPGASITATVNETVTIKASGDNTKKASVNMTINPLPRVHFVDLVHGKEFADVVATISDNALNPNKTMKTSVDWTTPNANDCEEQHLHLAGWILSTWADANPDATHSEIAGAGATNFYAPGAAINVLTNNGNTYYAVWAKEE